MCAQEISLDRWSLVFSGREGREGSAFFLASGAFSFPFSHSLFVCSSVRSLSPIHHLPHIDSEKEERNTGIGREREKSNGDLLSTPFPTFFSPLFLRLCMCVYYKCAVDKEHFFLFFRSLRLFFYWDEYDICTKSFHLFFPSPPPPLPFLAFSVSLFFLEELEKKLSSSLSFPSLLSLIFSFASRLFIEKLPHPPSSFSLDH